jgi:hypothetical protein
MILPDLLSLSVVSGVFSRVRAPGNVLQNMYGVGIGGPNNDQIPTRMYSYDVFNYARGIAKGRAPGVGPSRVAPVPVGNVQGRCARFYEKLELDYETLAAIRTIGENAGVQDRMGLRYLERQARELKRRHQNAREFLTAAVLRGGAFSLWATGDDLIPVWSLGGQPGIDVDLKVPAANKSKLNMLGAGDILAATWANAATPIVTHLINISSAFQQIVGEPLAQVNLNDAMWLYVLSNTQVINLGGTANTPFAQYEMLSTANEEGRKTGIQKCRIRGLPWLEWNVYSGVVEVVNPATGLVSTDKLLPDNYASFHIAHDPSWFDMLEGSEPVKENVLAPVELRAGFTSWMKETDEPARVECHTLQNVTPRVTVPAALAYGNIVY